MTRRNDVEEKKERQFPLRTEAAVRLKNGREIPVTVSCRADGACVILPRSMKDLIFPKVVEGKKAKKEVKK